MVHQKFQSKFVTVVYVLVLQTPIPRRCNIKHKEPQNRTVYNVPDDVQNPKKMNSAIHTEPELCDKNDQPYTSLMGEENITNMILQKF